MYNAINREAMTLVANGITSIEDVDRAWMGVMKMAIGPFGMLDAVGLDTVWHITDYWAGILGDAQMRRNADFVKAYVDRGCCGVQERRGLLPLPESRLGGTRLHPDGVSGVGRPLVGASLAALRPRRVTMSRDG